MNPQTVATAFITQLAAQGVTAHMYDYPVDEPQVPAVECYPDTLFDLSFEPSTSSRYVVLGLTPNTNTADGVGQAYAFLANTGSQSIEAAVYADSTLGGVVDSVELVQKTFTFVALGETQRRYFGARHVFEILSSS